MTCIIGLADKKSGKVYIGGDSAGSNGWSIQVRADEKVFVNGEFLMGFTTSFRMGNLLRYKLTPPEHPSKMTGHSFMVQRFIAAVQTCLEEGGWQQKDKDRKEGGAFLVGYRGDLYLIESDYQVGIIADGIASVGCGEQVALGAMHALDKMKPRERILRSLEITTSLYNHVRPPFVIMEAP